MLSISEKGIFNITEKVLLTKSTQTLPPNYT